MVGLPETPIWEADIYQIEQNDPVVGGAPSLALGQGIANIPHQQLAHRTAFLKQELDTLAAQTATAIRAAAPAGAVLAFATTTPPDGWLECDGSAINRSAYAALFSAIGTTFGSGDGSTTFALPDLRGEFIRGWDHGRGVDANRVFGSAQADQIKKLSLAKDMSATSDPATHLPMFHASPGSVFNGGLMDMQGTGPGGETRPRNIALMLCIKY